jgi:hypothetical protein
LKPAQAKRVSKTLAQKISQARYFMLTITATQEEDYTGKSQSEIGLSKKCETLSEK